MIENPISEIAGQWQTNNQINERPKEFTCSRFINDTHAIYEGLVQLDAQPPSRSIFKFSTPLPFNNIFKQHFSTLLFTRAPSMRAMCNSMLDRRGGELLNFSLHFSSTTFNNNLHFLRISKLLNLMMVWVVTLNQSYSSWIQLKLTFQHFWIIKEFRTGNLRKYFRLQAETRNKRQETL